MSMSSEAGGGLHTAEELRNFQRLFAARLALRIQSYLQELHRRDARYFHWILECQEDALGGALGRVELKNRFSVVENVAFGDFVVLAASEDIGQSRFAGTVRAHDRRDFTGLDRKIQAANDLGAVLGDARMQISDFQHSSTF